MQKNFLENLGTMLVLCVSVPYKLESLPRFAKLSGNVVGLELPWGPNRSVRASWHNDN